MRMIGQWPILLLLFLVACSQHKYEHRLADIDEFAEFSGEEETQDSDLQTYKYSPGLKDECTNGITKSCLVIGLAEEKNKNYQQANEFLSIACNLNNVDGCVRLAKVFGKQGLWGQVYAALEKACRLGHGKSCSHLGHVSLNDRGDETQALSYFIQACHQEIPFTCKQAGLLFYQRNQLRKALPLFSKSCRINDPAGCFNAAIVENELSNSENATRYFKLSCEAQEVNGCYNYAVFLARSPDKITQALDVFAKTLSLGFKDWHLIEHDLDLNPLRSHPNFGPIVRKYKQQNPHQRP